MVEIVSTLTTNLFRAFIIRRFLSLFFLTDIENKKKEKTVYSLFIFMTAFVFFAFHFPPFTLAINLLLIYLITQLYDGAQKKKILISLLIYGTNMFCDTISAYSFSNYIVGNDYNELVPYLTVFLFSICEFLIERFLTKNKQEDMVPPCWKILLTIPIISILLLLILVMNNLNNRIILISVSLGILIINLLIFYLYDVLVEAYLKLKVSTLFERQAAVYSNQLNVMRQSEEKVHTLRHDMKHHLIELENMIDRHADEEMKDYIHNIYGYMENPNEYSRSGNYEVDSLLNYMLVKADSILDKVNCTITVPKELKICSFDINVIIGNLLDNAILAAGSSQKKWLEISLSYEQGILFINIRNSYDNILRKHGDKYITTKKDRQEHGIGLQSVRKVVESYEGSIQISDKNNVFDVKIMLYMT